MIQKDAAGLPLGLYRMFWKDGGSSLASIGQTYNGTRWFAPSNWTTQSNKHPLVASTNWRMVERVDLILAHS